MKDAESLTHFKPFVPMNKEIPESNSITIVMGILFAILFAAANVYLGLKTGLTIAAAIPGSILGTGLLKLLFKKNSILEANLVASMAAVGESIAGGIVFTLPAIIIWGHNLTPIQIGVITMLGGLLGTLFIVPFRQYLIVEEHGKLLFPESVAVSEILINANEGGKGLKTVFKGIGLGGVFKFLGGGLAVFSEEPSWAIPKLGTAFGLNAVASLMGVGFIVGLEVAKYMFAGALLAWFGFIPLVTFLGHVTPVAIFPGPKPISELVPIQIWSYYIRYIGAGAVAIGGFISLIKSAPAIINSFSQAMKGLKGEKIKGQRERQNVDTPLTWVIAGAVAVFLIVWLVPIVNGIPALGFLPALLVVFFAFFFGVVSARMCGVAGASNNPVSGMTIASLLIIATVIKITGVGGGADTSKVMAIIAAGIVCVSIAVSGGVSQSLKHTYIIGGTPKKVEWGMYFGLIFSAFAAGGVIILLHRAFGLGTQQAPAPQAGLMRMLSEGVMTGNIPWTLVIIGVAFGVFIYLLGLPVLPIALGFYLPIGLSASILIGAIVRAIVDKKYKNSDEAEERSEKGVLLSSGIVAGDALVGILIAGLITAGVDMTGISKNLGAIAQSPWTSLVFILIVCVFIYVNVVNGKVEKKER